MDKVTGMFLLLLSSVVMATDVYIWEDERGITHYSQYPPEGQKAERRIFEEPGPHANSVISRSTRNRDFQSTAKTVEKDNLDLAALRFCTRAQFNHKVLSTYERIKLTDDKGESKILDENERQQQLQLAQRQIELFCPKKSGTGS